jgi:translation initiation factor 1A
MGRGNQKGGKKHKRGKKDGYETKALRLKEEGQEYAQIIALKGNCRFDVKCFDGKERMAIVCGAMRKRKFVNAKDIILVSLRDFQDDKCDIIDVYDDNQVHQLKSGKHIPEFINTGESNEFCEEIDGGIEFTMDMDIQDEDSSDSEDSGIDLDDI